jgi:hypothetical protein
MSESRPLPPPGIHPRPAVNPQARPVITPPPKYTPGAVPQPPAPPKPADSDEPISLVEETPGTATSKIRAITGAGLGPSVHNYKRQPNATGHGAIRVRSFHGRLSEEGLDFLDSKINEWLDQHPEIEVKFVTTTIGVFEGKIREQALVVNVWY